GPDPSRSSASKCWLSSRLISASARAAPVLRPPASGVVSAPRGFANVIDDGRPRGAHATPLAGACPLPLVPKLRLGTRGRRRPRRPAQAVRATAAVKNRLDGSGTLASQTTSTP